MSIKQTEACPYCTHEAMPTDKAMPVEYKGDTFPARFWRYVCDCGWRWANESQRRHNEHEFSRAYSTWKQRMMVG